MISLKQLAALHSVRVRGVASRDDGRSAVLFVYEAESYENYFTFGYWPTLRKAVEWAKDIFANYDTEEFKMNLFKNNKLFPHIRGVMLKEKRVTLTMSGKVNIVEMREGNDARVEMSFTDHKKSAVVNRTQAMILADIYGPETDDWVGKKVVLFGEFGTWFGKETWGLRVDKKATEAASRVKNGNGAAPPPEDEHTEPPWTDELLGDQAELFDNEEEAAE